MLLVIPSIDLKDGVCKNRIAGKKGTETFYDELAGNPPELCKLFRKENAKSIQINDVDSFSKKSNQTNINSILFITEIVDIPVQLKSNFRSFNECRMFLENGVYRVILNQLPFIEREQASELIKDFTPSRVMLNVHSNNGYIVFDGINDRITEKEYIKLAKKTGFQRIVLNRDEWINEDREVNVDELVKLSKEMNVKITVEDGVKFPEKLWEIERKKDFRVDSVVIGEPLYSNSFPCQKIWRMIEAEVEAK